MPFALNRPTPSAKPPGRHLPNRLPPGHDLGWCRGAVVGGALETSAVTGYQVGAWHGVFGDGGVDAAGVVTVLLSSEPRRARCPPRAMAWEWLRGALVDPFADFIGRYRWQALLVLGLIAVYRIADVVMGIMANPFYVDMGFTKDEVAAVTKVYGVVMTLAGAFVAAPWRCAWGVMRVLMLGAVLSGAAICCSPGWLRVGTTCMG